MSILKVNGDGNSILITKFDGSTQLVPKSGIIPPGSTLFNTPDNILSANISAIANISTFALSYTPVPETRTLTINGVTYDLSADRSWTIAGGVTSFNTRTGAITLLNTDVTGALGYTPVTNARTLTINGTTYDLTADRSWTLATGLTNWTEAFSSATQATSSLTATNAAENVNAAIVPKGNGAIVAAIPNGTATGGNARGIYAVDLQLIRSAADNVSSGNYSVIGGGVYNIASGISSTVGGGGDVFSSTRGNFARAAYSTISGGRINAIDAASSQSTIGGGGDNAITNSTDSTIAGGNGNRINNTIDGGFVAGNNNSVTFRGAAIGRGCTSNGLDYPIAMGDACTASQWGSSVGGGKSNTASGQYSRIGGGQTNTASGSHSAVLGGQSNTASATHTTIGGGQSNTASGIWSFIGGGQLNASAGYYNVIGGGFTNSGTANAAATTQITTIARTANTTLFLSSANANIRVGQYITGSGISADTYATSTVTTATAVMNTSTISGTTLTVGSLGSGTIAAGMVLTGTGVTAGTYIVSGSGLSWTVSVSQTVASTTITGTSYTITISQAATTAAAITLSFFIPHGVVVGGGNNQATGLYSFIGGGGDAGTAANRNIASGDWSVVVGGQLNTAAGLGSFVGSGIYNRANGLRSVIVGGGLSSTNSNRTESRYSFIGGGYNNLIASSGASDTGAIIAGGLNNRIDGGGTAFIGGGDENQINKPEVNSGSYCTIVAGYRNKITGPYSSQGFLGGGAYNTLGNGYSMTIAGGGNNTINGSGSFIGGGNQNTIGSFPTDAALTGGRSNTISANGNYGAIGGGQSNTASATHTTVSGGQSNTASGSYSMVIGGLSANSNLYGQSSHASGQFSAQGDAQAHELIWRRAITGTATTELFLDGASIVAVLPATNTVWHGIIDVVAICTVAGAGTTVVGHVEATSYKVTIKRIGTTTSLVGGVQEIGITNADASMSTSVFTIDNNDTNESLRIQFTPPSTAAADTVIRAVATFRGTQIKY